jgi:hypothetical protein
MSADPFANTVTVKNILNHIISPKIVKDGSGGYTTKTDLVNIDNLIFASRGDGTGTSVVPMTAQCGVVEVPRSSVSVTVFHSRVTTSSIILATNETVITYSDGDTRVSYITPASNSFTITLNQPTTADGPRTYIFWFIASF